MADKNLAIVFLAFLAGFLLVAFFANGKLAYARCTEEDVRTGNCQLPNHDETPPAAIGQNEQPTVTTAAMLQECRDLGIASEQCTEEQILSARHITTCCPPGVSDPNVVSEPKLNPVIIEILAGSGLALVASIIGIRKSRTIKKNKPTGSS